MFANLWDRQTASRLVAVGVIVVALPLGAGATVLGKDHLELALILCLLPLLGLLVLHPQVSAIAALACLPFESNVIGAVAGAPNVSVSDLLWAAAFAGLLLSLNARGEIRQRLMVIRPLLPLIAAYFAALLIVFAVNPSLPGAVALVQRVEVVVVPMLIGAVVLTVRTAHIGMAVFIAAALVLGIAFLMSHVATGGLLGVQKNPAGQYLVDAALIALTVFTVKRVRFAVVPILVLGAYATESRGALIGLVAALVVWCLLRARDPFQAIVRGAILVVLLLGAYLAIPAAEQSRIRGDTASTIYNDNLRSNYIADAWEIFTENPVVGVGVANYFSGDPAHNDVTNDPHNIALLEAAEGGALLVSAFVVLQIGALVVVFRRRRRSAWATPAICVQVAILVHGMVDVYWVRGTPVIGWLLIGLALSPVGLWPSGSRHNAAAKAIQRSPAGIEP